MSLQRVTPGQAFRPTAADWNILCESGQDYLNRRQQFNDAAPGRLDRSQTIVLVSNATGNDLPAFSVVGLGDALIHPQDDLNSFTRRSAFVGEKPALSHGNKFAITLTACPTIADGTPGDGQQIIVPAVAFGIVQVQVEMAAETDTNAAPKLGETDRLLSGGGAAELLWVEPYEERNLAAPTLAWAIVRIGGGGGSGVVASFARITSRAGTAPPFLYSANQVQKNAAGDWIDTPGGAILSNNLRNIEEQGAAGQWVNPLLMGSVVVFFLAPGAPGFYECSRSHYRGEY